MIVKKLDLAEPGQWDTFVMRHPAATFFHLSGWGRVIEKSFGHACYYVYVEKAGEIAGILPLTFIKSRLFGNSLVSNGFSVYGGPVANNESAHEALDEAAWEIAQKLGADHVEYRNQSRLRPAWPCKDSMYVTFKKAIDPDQDVNLKAIPRKQRAVVRKGISNALESSFAPDLDTFFAMYSASVRNLGTPVFSKKFFRNLLEEFGRDAEILIIRKDGRPLSAVLSFYFRDEVLPYYGGGTAEARKWGANDFMYWALMDHAREKGCRIFDYGRSKVGTGSYSFKKYWGFEPEPLYYEFRLAKGDKLPEINPLNPKYKVFIAAWKKLPQWAANRIGPVISKDLG